MSRAYLDTSALAKWYLNEPRSDEVEAYILGLEEPLITSLTLVEMRSLLARHRRMGHLDPEMEARVFARVLEDVERGHLLSRPLEDRWIQAAAHLITRLDDVPLRTLDALHLSACQSLGAEEIATADRVLTAAAEGIGVRVVGFG